ncbi:hypothetical protein STXM2123_1796 [Streptomyces sp. F-3]|nr:hypothetical protein STXM2123_1796 [Streptomyces sp. F-3]
MCAGAGRRIPLSRGPKASSGGPGEKPGPPDGSDVEPGAGSDVEVQLELVQPLRLSAAKGLYRF